MFIFQLQTCPVWATSLLLNFESNNYVGNENNPHFDIIYFNVTSDQIAIKIANHVKEVKRKITATCFI